MRAPLSLALVGGIVAALAQRLVPTGWWLNSGRGVALTCVVFVALAAAIGRMAPTPSRESRGVVRPIALWGGANLGLALVYLALVYSVSGAGSIFPIVLIFGGGLSALAIGGGWLIGLFLRTRTRP